MRRKLFVLGGLCALVCGSFSSASVSTRLIALPTLQRRAGTASKRDIPSDNYRGVLLKKMLTRRRPGC